MSIISSNSKSDRTKLKRIVGVTKLDRKPIREDKPFPIHEIVVATGLICASTLLVMFGARPERQRVLEATTRMERLATNLARAHTIAPATARGIARLIEQPQYHCTRMACGDALDARNRKARIKLKTLIGMASASGSSGGD